MEGFGMDSEFNHRPSIISGPSSPPLLTWTFNDILRDRCRLHGDDLAVVSHHQNQEYTYAELNRRSSELAAGLHCLGVRKGDRVGVLLGNRSEYVDILSAFGTSKRLKATAPKVLLTTLATSRFDYKSALDAACSTIAGLHKVILLEDISNHRNDVNPSNFFVSYKNVTILGGRSTVNLRALENQVADQDILNLQFTSGSTGLPKAAALTHHSMLNSARYIGLQMKVKPAERFNIPVPLFHTFGLIIGLRNAVVYGASIILPLEYFDAGATLYAVERYKSQGYMALQPCSWISCPILTSPPPIEPPYAMPKELLNRVVTKFPIPELFTNWGMTELSSIATMTTATDPVEKKMRTAGWLLANFTGKIVDPSTARTLPWGQRGEIVISGFGVMHPYYNDIERTKEALRLHNHDSNSSHVDIDSESKRRKWMHTGDEGYLDKDGYFVITGRIKDLIIRGGENISPLEIEARLYEHSAIKQAAVFGVPSARYGEEVAAMSELEDSVDSRPSDAEIKAWVRRELSRFKTPAYIWWLGDAVLAVPEEWPKTANGKLRKHDIRKIGEEILKHGAVTSQPQIMPSL
ncbi:hypothetical protein BCR34DRAFT_606004 [Clohesyomyces aquaticus]|uniref:Acetyl-CoA synthetase-like protein n=1 Tax=Clohesyomyces aquaticus TaxID=1231657 RepID=A0A1Y1YU76_9PLEO|nr:hypothetical protein BCR34DRAFT_606004 [Clohesyomyces aquaticus]